MSSDRDLSAFVAAIEASLRDKVLPATAGDTRFAGLMAASALGMVQREIALKSALASASQAVSEFAPQPSPFEDPAEALVHLIRGGLTDGQDELHRRLMVDAITRTSVTRPQALTQHDTTLAGLK